MGRQKDKKESPVKAKKKVYAVCEGLTEKQYLEYFGNCNRTAGLFEILVYEKETFDRSQSDRMQLVYMLKGEMELKTNGKYTAYTYVTKYLHRCLDSELKNLDDSEKKKVHENLNEVRDSVIKIIKNTRGCLDDDGFVKQFDSIEKLVKSEISRRSHLKHYSNCFEIDPSDLRDPELSTTADIDRYFVVFDRDLDLTHPEKHTVEDYRDVFKECDKNGYEVLLSTPFFEFWLLLHHLEPKPLEYMHDLSEKETILGKLKDAEKDGCDDWIVREIEGVKRISQKRFDRYYNMKQFEIATSRSKKLETDLEELLYASGTNIGIKLETLLKE